MLRESGGKQNRSPFAPESRHQHQDRDRDYIGFATLPDQVHRKSVKRGFDFTLMVVGESGLGKSTLINSLFLEDLYKTRRIPDVSERIQKTTTIERKTMEIEERGVKLRLTIIDTPGFGDAVNCEDSWRVCINYIDEQFRQYFTDESGLNRRNIQDNRVHCCLYFVPPWGHSLRHMDLELMKRLHHKVNIVVVIAKADTLTTTEVAKLKKNILNDIRENHIQMYEFPECDSDEDEEFKQQDRELKASVPFAVVGSNTTLEIAGKKIRGRQYPWGVVDVENPKHSDFIKLRTMLISTHMQDLKDVTEDVHYENFRAQCISQISQHARERGERRYSTLDSSEKQSPNITPIDSHMPEISFRRRTLRKILMGLNTNKACGSDGIPPIVLKKCAPELTPVLCMLFNYSYKLGIFPSNWKIARLQPVPIKGKKTLPSNYRPITLLSIISKIMEKTINIELMEYLEHSDIINDRQYGFT
ncbi:unnamed protein product [Phaedon cochleariae]|uniref:Septin-type G domain-containing protein n=1 Tax=Phaedon cochleariae TaxID=80249 RepID=A0A9N9S7K1_PHACE|nr:unnamed protein product [Phaedon cochleariae]